MTAATHGRTSPTACRQTLVFAWRSIRMTLTRCISCRLSQMSIAVRRRASCASIVRGNAGASWEPLTRGLPQKNALETVLRDSMATDTCDPAGIYFGTRSGKVYGSSDDGKSWQAMIEGLPPVVCVKAALVGDGAERSTTETRRHGEEKGSARRSDGKTHDFETSSTRPGKGGEEIAHAGQHPHSDIPCIVQRRTERDRARRLARHRERGARLTLASPSSV